MEPSHPQENCTGRIERVEVQGVKAGRLRVGLHQGYASLIEVTLGVRVMWIWATVWTGTLWGAGFWHERAAERLLPD